MSKTPLILLLTILNACAQGGGLQETSGRDPKSDAHWDSVRWSHPLPNPSPVQEPGVPMRDPGNVDSGYVVWEVEALAASNPEGRPNESRELDSESGTSEGILALSDVAIPLRFDEEGPDLLPVTEPGNTIWDDLREITQQIEKRLSGASQDPINWSKIGEIELELEETLRKAAADAISATLRCAILDKLAAEITRALAWPNSSFASEMKKVLNPQLAQTKAAASELSSRVQEAREGFRWCFSRLKALRPVFELEDACDRLITEMRRVLDNIQPEEFDGLVKAQRRVDKLVAEISESAVPPSLKGRVSSRYLEQLDLFRTLQRLVWIEKARSTDRRGMSAEVTWSSEATTRAAN